MKKTAIYSAAFVMIVGLSAITGCNMLGGKKVHPDKYPVKITRKDFNLQGDVKTAKITSSSPDPSAAAPGHRYEAVNYTFVSFNKQGFITQQDAYEPAKTTNAFDETGYRMTAQKLMGSGDQLLASRKYKYDAQNRITEFNTFDAQDVRRAMEKYEYDSTGNVKTRTISDTTGNAMVKVAYGYDAKGNETSETIFDGTTGTQATTQSTYDAHDNRTSFAVNSQDQQSGQTQSFTMTYTYDDKNNVLVEAIKSSRGEMSRSYTYKYDKNNNWTERTITQDGKVIQTDKQELTYY